MHVRAPLAGAGDTAPLRVPVGAVRLAGHHNRNFIVPVSADAWEKYRYPIAGARRFDWFAWADENEVLRCLARVPGWSALVPRVLRSGHGTDAEPYSVHTYVDGDSLEKACPAGQEVPGEYLDQIVELFRMMAGMPLRILPANPAGWPADGDSGGFFAACVDVAQKVFEGHLGVYGMLFDELGVVKDALLLHAERSPAPRPRPFILLHGDLHRENIIVRRHSGKLFFIDWELAMRGDPVYDLATHLRLMRYPKVQADSAAERWSQALRAVDEGLVAGWSRDLRTYLGFKRIQAVHTDTVRIAVLVERGRLSPERAAGRLLKVLREARPYLGMARLPERRRIVAALTEWRQACPRDSLLT